MHELPAVRRHRERLRDLTFLAIWEIPMFHLYADHTCGANSYQILSATTRCGLNNLIPKGFQEKVL